MRPIMKKALRSAMVSYCESMVRRHIAVLEEMRWRMKHPSRGTSGGDLSDKESHLGLIKAQIMVIRRAKLSLEDAKLDRKIRTMNLVITAAPERENGPIGIWVEHNWSDYDDPSGLEDPETPEEEAEQRELDRVGRAGLDFAPEDAPYGAEESLP